MQCSYRPMYVFGHCQGAENVVAKSRLFTVTPRQKKKSGNVMSIFGTGAMGNIKVVKTESAPDLDAGTLSEYLKDKLGCEVICQKTDTVHRQYSSFKVSAKCNEVSEMYNLELWPDTLVLFRHYYEPHNVGVIGSNTAHAAEGMSVAAGSVNTH